MKLEGKETSVELLQKILDNKNLYNAYKQSNKNKVASEVDVNNFFVFNIFIAKKGGLGCEHSPRHDIIKLKYEIKYGSDTLMTKKKSICVYTCITGNYDNLKEIENLEPEIDYYCFTNNHNIQSNTWNVVYIEDEKLSDIQLARKIKILGHEKINKDYEIHVWMDGTVIFRKKISDFVNYYLKEEDNLVMFKHGERSSIYEEAFACLNCRKEKKKKIETLFKFYEKENYKYDNGLVESTVFIRRTKNKKVQSTMKLWFDMIINYSTRDQLSFNYCIYKTKLKVKMIEEKVFDNTWFIWKKHNSDFNNKYKVYYDYGNGFSEENCDEKTYKSKSNKKSIEVTVPKGCNNIRLDPTDKDFMYIKNLEITENIDFNCFNMEKYGNYYLFLNDDPSIMINVKNIDKFKISYELYENSDDINKKLINLLYIDKVRNENIIDNFNKLNESTQNELKKVKNDLNNIYNSRSWRITKPIRIIANKLRNIRGVLNEK